MIGILQFGKDALVSLVSVRPPELDWLLIRLNGFEEVRRHALVQLSPVVHVVNEDVHAICLARNDSIVLM
jgi:hypothetical protein